MLKNCAQKYLSCQNETVPDLRTCTIFSLYAYEGRLKSFRPNQQRNRKNTFYINLASSLFLKSFEIEMSVCKQQSRIGVLRRDKIPFCNGSSYEKHRPLSSTAKCIERNFLSAIHRNLALSISFCVWKVNFSALVW